MEKFLNAPTMNVVIICATVVFLIGILYFILRRFKNISLGSGDKKISLSKEDDRDTSCSQYKFIALVMNFADRKLQAVVDFHLEVYKQELLKYSDNPHNIEDYNNYYVLTNYIRFIILDKIKQYTKENGYQSMTEEDYSKYRKDRSEALVSEWERNLNLYFSSLMVSRMDLEKLYMKDEGFMFDSFKEIFDFVKKSVGA
jgi:hypothetical protein